MENIVYVIYIRHSLGVQFSYDFEGAGRCLLGDAHAPAGGAVVATCTVTVAAAVGLHDEGAVRVACDGR